MILNVSGRTDIVAFYAPWFLNRLKEGYLLVQNPYNDQQLSKVDFENVDLIVFCTKNPLPILPDLSSIKIPYLFQITLTPYHKDIEPFVPDKKMILDAIQTLNGEYMVKKPSLRYDPILIDVQRYTVDYHIRAFQKLAKTLEGKVDRVILSFVDPYKNMQRHQKEMGFRAPDLREIDQLGHSFGQIAKRHALKLQTCFETVDLSRYGITQDVCLSQEEAFLLTGKKFPLWKARSCGCVEMVDIGDYNTCRHLCRYCYANYDEGKIISKIRQHDIHSPLLIGWPKPWQMIYQRKG